MIIDPKHLTEMNLKASLIRESQSQRLRNRAHYMEILQKYNAHDGWLYKLPIQKLKVLVEEL